jgi:raffinose/stachyose/melibiose transport system permease protein
MTSANLVQTAEQISYARERRRANNAKRIQRISSHTLAILISLIFFIPLYLIVVNSLKDSAQASTMGMELPNAIHLDNFLVVIERGKLLRTFFNSVLYSGSSTIISTVLASMAAYVLSRNRSRLNTVLYFFIIMGIAMPINFFTLTQMMQLTQLINTQYGLVLLYSATQIPFNVFLMYGYIESIPRELDEAAIVDGCSPIRLYISVIFPLLTPVLVTAAVLSFVGTWSEFLFPLYYLNNSNYWPMTLAVYNFFGQFESDWNLVMADILLTILPVIVIYVLGQRFIVSGMTAGSVKG